jgi:two-component system chemotaxis sensor kinase CheA
LDELLSQFLLEARELVQQAADDLLGLERHPDNRIRLDGAFRAVHTLKGSVGLFDWPPMGAALHAGEDLLSALRDGRASVDRASIDALMALIGQTESWIEAIATSGRLPQDAARTGALIAADLGALLSEEPEEEHAMPDEAETAWADRLAADHLVSQEPSQRPDGALLAIRYVPHPECFFAGDDPMALIRAVPGLVSLRISPREPWATGGALDPFACNLVIEALSSATRSAIQPVFRFVPDQVRIHEIEPAAGTPAELSGDAEGGRVRPAGAASPSLRVDPERIDRLVDLVGELVVAKNTLSFLANQAIQGADTGTVAEDLAANQATIGRLVSTLHAAIMGVRMLPLHDVFRRLPRAVRDVAGRLGKDVDLIIRGETVEADKAVVEGLSEPLLHLIRNAVDHGLEAAQARREAGKPARGRIEVRAHREGDRIVIEVADDGRGIDPVAIRALARERGVAPADVLDRMSDVDAINLVFAPGFSTAGQVTDISGRGVGMDAVRVAVERLGGRVSLQSVSGRGTTVRLNLRVTAVMTKVMVVRVGADRFGLPMDSIVETARIPAERVMPIREGEAFVHRGRTVPLLRLAALLGLPEGADETRELTVVLVEVGGESVGIAVDGFGERMDVLLRPLTGLLAGVPGFAGTTLEGNGTVLLVLDLPELIG